jgi:hypothetical protein
VASFLHLKAVILSVWPGWINYQNMREIFVLASCLVSLIFLTGSSLPCNVPQRAVASNQTNAAPTVTNSAPSSVEIGTNACGMDSKGLFKRLIGNRSKDKLNTLCRFDPMEDKRLQEKITQINIDYLQGEKSVDQRNKEMNELMNYWSVGRSSEDVASLREMIMEQSQLVATQYFFPMVMKSVIHGTQSIPLKFKQKLLGYNILDPDAYLKKISDYYSPHYRYLVEQGAKYNDQTGWDFRNVDLSPGKFLIDLKLFTSFSELFSVATAMSLGDRKRNTAVILDNQVILPLARPEFGRNRAGQVIVLERAVYTRAVNKIKEMLSDAFEDYLRLSSEVGSYSNLMEGHLNNHLRIGFTDKVSIPLWKQNRGERELTPEEKAFQMAYRNILFLSDRLIRDYGVAKPMALALYEAIRYAQQIDQQNLDAGKAKLRKATWAAIAAPFIPAAIALAPHVAAYFGYEASLGTGVNLFTTGASFKLLAGGVALNSAAAFAAFPLLAGPAVSAINASMMSQLDGRSFGYHYTEELALKGSSALIQAPFMAALASGVTGIAAAAGAMGLAEASAGVLGRAVIEAGIIGRNTLMIGRHGAQAAALFEGASEILAIKVISAGPQIIFTSAEMAAGFWFMLKMANKGVKEIDCCIDEAKRLYRITDNGKAPQDHITYMAMASCFFDMWEKSNIVATFMGRQVQYSWSPQNPLNDSNKDGQRSQSMGMTNGLSATESSITTNAAANK